MNTPHEVSRLRVPFTDLLDLASEKVGGAVLAASDDFFAPKENLIKSASPIFIPDQYTEFGKWMDGWESRRKRNLSPTHNHDWCVIQLGLPGIIRGVNVDTAFFVGNYPEFCSLEGLEVSKFNEKDAPWQEILPQSKLQGGMGNLFPILSSKRWTHLRLRIFPDGGVARLRVYGEVVPDWNRIGKASKELFDFAAAAHGGQVIACSDMFFGQKDQLILPGHPITMGEGWETRRRRGPGHDWILVRLAQAANIQKLEINTHHFKGNFPESCSVDALSYSEGALSEKDFRDRSDLEWQEILPRTPLQADAQRIFEKELLPIKQKITHLRLNIYPDGGISRFRAYGNLG